MIKNYLLFMLLVLGSLTCFSQTSNDTIKADKIFGDYKYYLNNTELKAYELSNLISKDSLAYKKYSASEVTAFFSYLFAGSGGFLIGYPIGGYLANGEFNTPLFLAGVALAAVGISFSIIASNQLKSSVDIYNRNRNKLSYSRNNRDVKLNIGLTYNGAGLTLSF